MVQQSNIYDYYAPRMPDIPGLHIRLIETPNHPTGAGQNGDPHSSRPAISNAVYQLTGVRLREQPMLADRVHEALRAAGRCTS